MNYIGLDKESTKATADKLNTLLANYHLYYQKLRAFHWNIEGKHFFDLHENFEQLYTTATVSIDDIAERILIIGHNPVSTLKQYLDMSEIKEISGALSSDEMVKEVLEDHRILANLKRKVIKSAGDGGDEGTIDLVAGQLGAMEKSSWILHSFHSSDHTVVRENLN